MADATYPLGGQGVYRKQGGTETVVGSSGLITVEDGGQFAVPVTVKTTSTGTITNYGVTTFGSTSANTYTLAAPDRAGLRKTLICTVHGATTVTAGVATASTNSYIRNSTGVAADTHTLTFLSAGEYAELISVSTSEWRIINVSGADLT